MAVYAISDLHLSLANPKPMDIFGSTWENHAEKIREHWDSTITKNDIVLLPGDLSWAMRLSEAKADLNFIAKRPGKKVLIRGNHDYWWQRKMTSRIQSMFTGNMYLLQGSSVVLHEAGITGTRGWRVDWEPGMEKEKADVKIADSEKILQRELRYLEQGLSSIPESVDTRIAMLHYPPFDEYLKPNEFANLLKKYSVDILVYGHIHLGLGNWLCGDVDGVIYHMVSADVVDFTPQLIMP